MPSLKPSPVTGVTVQCSRPRHLSQALHLHAQMTTFSMSSQHTSCKITLVSTFLFLLRLHLSLLYRTPPTPPRPLTPYLSLPSRPRHTIAQALIFASGKHAPKRSLPVMISQTTSLPSISEAEKPITNVSGRAVIGTVQTAFQASKRYRDIFRCVSHLTACHVAHDTI